MRRLYIFMALLLITSIAVAQNPTKFIRGVKPSSQTTWQDSSYIVATTAGDDSVDFFFDTSDSWWTGFSSSGGESWTFLAWVVDDGDEDTGADDGPTITEVRCSPGYIIPSISGSSFTADTLCGSADVEHNMSDVLTTSVDLDDNSVPREVMCDVSLGTIPRCDFVRVYFKWSNDCDSDPGAIFTGLKGVKK